MEILLIRHGKAVEDAPGLGDAGRWLRPRGREVTRKVGRWLGKRRGGRPTSVWTSPLVRAVQTAELIAEGAGFEGAIEVCAELAPDREPEDLLERLASAPADGVLALVGHEPSLSRIAGALLGDVELAGLKKSGVVGLTLEDGAGQLRFVLDPSEMA